MKPPSPALVPQAAVRRLPRWALWALCATYVLMGWVERDPWRSVDMVTLGYIQSLELGLSGLWNPTLLGHAANPPALLPYWLGSLFMGTWDQPALVLLSTKLPFIAMTAIALMATWWGTYYLARRESAQPVAFAFGGEARPTDYARAVADGALLALMACLGLAQLSHEMSPALVQLAAYGLIFWGSTSWRFHPWRGSVLAVTGLWAALFSGAPVMSALAFVFGAYLAWREKQSIPQHFGPQHPKSAAFALLLLGAGAILSFAADQWRWKLQAPVWTWEFLSGNFQQLIWFTWPALPLATMAVWKWRRALWGDQRSSHIQQPLVLAAIPLLLTPWIDNSDRMLLIALPPLACLASFALPTLRRAWAACIDWFTLIFFTGCGFVIWVVWVAMQTGIPPQPAANVQRLAPGFVPGFDGLHSSLALVATLAWLGLVKWRVGRHRSALWKSLVLPAGGTTWCWLLLMTLWFPLLNHTQSYKALLSQVLAPVPAGACVLPMSLDTDHLAAMQWHYPGVLGQPGACEWALAEASALGNAPPIPGWIAVVRGQSPGNPNDALWLMQRVADN